jgi:hypothetical protein
MALVAVVERAGDRPGDLPVTRVVPVGLAQDVLMGAYFGRDSVMCAKSLPDSNNLLFCLREVSPADVKALPSEGRAVYRKGFSLRRLMTGKVRMEQEAMRPVGYESVSGVGDSEAALMALASSLEPDGGIPGKAEEARVLATILALLRFLAEGHSVSGGAFRAHVKRLVEFLEAWLKRSGERPGKSAGELEEAKLRVDVVKKIVEQGRSGRALPGDWSKRKPEPGLWTELAAALNLIR